MSYAYQTTQRGAIGLSLLGSPESRHSFPITSDLFSRAYGSIGVFFLSRVAYGSITANITLCDIWFDSANRYHLRYDYATRRIAFDLHIANNRISASVPAPLAANTCYFVSASWCPSYIRVIHASTENQTNKHGGFPIGEFPATVYVGNNRYATQPLNGIIWNMALLNRPVGMEIWEYLESFYRNFRLADFVNRKFRAIWYGTSEGKERYRLGN